MQQALIVGLIITIILLVLYIVTDKGMGYMKALRFKPNFCPPSATCDHGTSYIPGATLVGVPQKIRIVGV